jgi:hypothetical protein
MPGYDVDLNAWLDGVGFHPADTELKQRGHELARVLTALYATHLHMLLPPGRDKSLAFTKLEDVLVRSNRALALGGGPRDGVQLEGRGGLEVLLADSKRVLAVLGSEVPQDARIADYEADQRGGSAELRPTLEPFTYRHEFADGYEELEVGLTAVAGPEPACRIQTIEVFQDGTSVNAQTLVDDPEVLEEAAAYLLAMSARLRELKARPAADETVVL